MIAGRYTRISKCGHAVATCRPLLLVHVQFSKWHSWKLPNSTGTRVFCFTKLPAAITAASGSTVVLGVLGPEKYVDWNKAGVRVAMLSWKSNRYYIFCVCVSAALVIQHAKHMNHNILSPVTCQAPPCFSTRHDFRMKVTEHTICNFCLRLSSETFLILRRIQRDLWKQVP